MCVFKGDWFCAEEGPEAGREAVPGAPLEDKAAIQGGGEAGVDDGASGGVGEGFLGPPFLGLRCVLCISHILTPRRKVSGVSS